MVGLTDRLNMTIVVDWDVKPTTNQIQKKKINKLLTFFKMTPSFRGVSVRKFAEFLGDFSRSCSAKSRGEKKMVCASLREISRSFLRESLRLRIFVRGVNAKKELFSWADLYVHTYTC